MKLKFYQCKKCGQIITKVEGKDTDIICCGETMEEMIPNEVDAAIEKHVPIYVRIGNEIRVNVGAEDHPMTKEHYIKWIYVQTTQGAYFKCFRPDDRPRADFMISSKETLTSVYALCNIHGLWKA